MIKDIVESQRVKKIVRPRIKQCYANAAKVILALPEYADAAAARAIDGNNRLETDLIDASDVDHAGIDRPGGGGGIADIVSNRRE